MSAANELTAYGMTLPIVEWARRTGISRQLIRGRLRLGWPAEKIVITPAGAHTEISVETVTEIRARRARGEPYDIIARECGVSTHYAAEIVNRTARKDVP